MASLKSTLERVVDGGARWARDAQPKLRAWADARRAAARAGTGGRPRPQGAASGGRAARPAAAEGPGGAARPVIAGRPDDPQTRGGEAAGASEPPGTAPSARPDVAGRLDEPEPPHRDPAPVAMHQRDPEPNAAPELADEPRAAPPRSRASAPPEVPGRERRTPPAARRHAPRGLRAGARERGAMRRRLRELRRLREPLLMDAGAVAAELQRRGEPLPEPLARRVAELVSLERESEALARALGEGSASVELVAAGVAGRCRRCRSLVSSAAGYCQACGADLAAHPPDGRAIELGEAERELDDRLAPPAERRRERRGGVPGRVRTAARGCGRTRREAPPAWLDEAGAGSPAAPGPAGGLPPLGEQPEGATVALDPAPGDAAASRNRSRRAVAAAGGAVLAVVLITVAIAGSSGDDPAPESVELGSEPAPAEPAPAEQAPGAASDGPAAQEEQAAGGEAAGAAVEDVTAHEYDPLGDGVEHGEEVALALDGDAGTAWTTEMYRRFAKQGVGLRLEASSPVEAKGLRLDTPTPGWSVEVYGASGGPPALVPDSGWTLLATRASVETGTLELDADGRSFDQYLVWITALPDGTGSVEIAEAELRR